MKELLDLIAQGLPVAIVVAIAVFVFRDSIRKWLEKGSVTAVAVAEEGVVAMWRAYADEIKADLISVRADLAKETEARRRVQSELRRAERRIAALEEAVSALGGDPSLVVSD